MTTVAARPLDLRQTTARALVAGLVAALVAVAANTVVAQVALAVGASDDFQPLRFATFSFLTVLGVAAGLIGWLIVRRTANAASTLRWLVPAVLVLSLVPDVMLGLSDEPGVSWGAVAALMAMHVVVTVAAVATFSRMLPVRRAAA